VDVVTIENTDLHENDKDEEFLILYAFDDLKRKLKSKPIDFLNLHKLQIEIGKLGEAYVYELECKKLKGTKYLNKVDEKKALNPANGYDILSYTRDGSLLHIEVKATSGAEDTFYLSNHELQTAKRMKEEDLTYVIYFVKEILSDSPQLIKINDISMNEDYVFQEIMNWRVYKTDIPNN
jgi:hypothetical protein